MRLVLLAFGLIALGAASRLVGLPPNAVPLGAIALYAGARLPRRWAFAVPVAAMVLSDLYLDAFVYPAMQGRGFFSLVRLTNYIAFAAVAELGGLVRKDLGPFGRAGMSLGASTLFFLASNFAVWVMGEGLRFPLTPAGLLACYTFALPFFGNTVIADLLGTLGLFGTEAVVSRLRRPTKVVEPTLASELE